jgi:hypothetical protein
MEGALHVSLGLPFLLSAIEEHDPHAQCLDDDLTYWHVSDVCLLSQRLMNLARKHDRELVERVAVVGHDGSPALQHGGEMGDGQDPLR